MEPALLKKRRLKEVEFRGKRAADAARTPMRKRPMNNCRTHAALYAGSGTSRPQAAELARTHHTIPVCCFSVGNGIKKTIKTHAQSLSCTISQRHLSLGPDIKRKQPRSIVHLIGRAHVFQLRASYNMFADIWLATRNINCVRSAGRRSLEPRDSGVTS